MFSAAHTMNISLRPFKKVTLDKLGAKPRIMAKKTADRIKTAVDKSYHSGVRALRAAAERSHRQDFSPLKCEEASPDLPIPELVLSNPVSQTPEVVEAVSVATWVPEDTLDSACPPPKELINNMIPPPWAETSSWLRSNQSWQLHLSTLLAPPQDPVVIIRCIYMETLGKRKRAHYDVDEESASDGEPSPAIPPSTTPDSEGPRRIKRMRVARDTSADDILKHQIRMHMAMFQARQAPDLTERERTAVPAPPIPEVSIRPSGFPSPFAMACN
ncbi:hypothetical protein EVG20_g2584 [Dentipellis fragilis]|uniref:Uncharacterized protein n=1 Tax=Dentipellis fragilis TaxID=205917 RepID=A0A4Y9Z6P0_9AGAM|nr:hypothetical protein EVG20_g2584 [Dentipellis fragilis]